MGIEGALIAAVAVKGLASIGVGISTNEAAKSSASVAEAQGRLANLEAQTEADRTQREAEKFRARQKMLFVKSGVDLSGSPMLILEETRLEGEKQVSALRSRGRTLETFKRIEASQLRTAGRNAFVSGFVNAYTGAVTDIMTLKAGGFFKGKKGKG